MKLKIIIAILSVVTVVCIIFSLNCNEKLKNQDALSVRLTDQIDSLSLKIGELEKIGEDNLKEAVIQKKRYDELLKNCKAR